MSLKQVHFFVLILTSSIKGQEESCVTPVTASCGENAKDGGYAGIETRLFVGMPFTCNGTIVGWRLAGRVGSGRHYPRLQVWRRVNDSSKYFKPGEDITMEKTIASAPEVCGIFEHTLDEASRVYVQSGDILGIELPPGDDMAFDILYNHGGGPLTYVYRKRLSTPFDPNATTSRPFDKYHVQPLIHLTVAAEPQTIATTEVPVPATTNSNNMEYISNTTPSSGDKETEGQYDDYASDDVLIGVTVTAAAVTGGIQVVVVLTLVMLTIAMINIHRKLNKATKKQQDLSLENNSAYGVTVPRNQEVYDYI